MARYLWDRDPSFAPPIEVQALQYTGERDDNDAMAEFIAPQAYCIKTSANPSYLSLTTAHGHELVPEGHWVVKAADGTILGHFPDAAFRAAFFEVT